MKIILVLITLQRNKAVEQTKKRHKWDKQKMIYE